MSMRKKNRKKLATFLRGDTGRASTNERVSGKSSHSNILLKSLLEWASISSWAANTAKCPPPMPIRPSMSIRLLFPTVADPVQWVRISSLSNPKADRSIPIIPNRIDTNRWQDSISVERSSAAFAVRRETDVDVPCWSLPFCSSLGDPTNGERPSQKQGSLCKNNHPRTDSLFGFHHHLMHKWVVPRKSKLSSPSSSFPLS